jgi:signal transduction histidine kinase
MLEWDMISRLDRLSRRYAATLYCYFCGHQEVLLQQAYELGRRAIAGGFGVLEIGRVHQQALAAWLTPNLRIAERRRRLRAAEAFLLEVLSPFEAAHRGFREANLALERVNTQLECRNLQLGAANRQLNNKVLALLRAEKALRTSQDHYRQLFCEAKLMQDNLRNLSNQVLHVQERERKHISRELHDEVGQALTALNTDLTLLRRNGHPDPKWLHNKIGNTQQLLQQTMETVHRFARELRPAMLDELGLLPALRCYLKAFALRTGLRVRFDGNPAAEKLNDEQKTVLFRVTQESLTNVARHAQASHVTVSMRALANRLRLRIKDNGKAFDVDHRFRTQGRKRLGLMGMQERVRLVNGKFAIQSSPGSGTAVRVEIPFKNGSARAS